MDRSLTAGQLSDAQRIPKGRAVTSALTVMAENTSS